MAKSLTQEFVKGLWDEVPPFRLVLGLCPVLAVTKSVENGIGMGVATTFVLVGSNVLVSMLRKLIPSIFRVLTEDKVAAAHNLLGVSRSDWTDAVFREQTRQALHDAGYDGSLVEDWCRERVFFEPMPTGAADLTGLRNRIEEIEVGRDGLYLTYMGRSGVLRPRRQPGHRDQRIRGGLPRRYGVHSFFRHLPGWRVPHDEELPAARVHGDQVERTRQQ